MRMGEPARMGTMNSVHEVFEHRAALAPDAIAVNCGPGRYTYAELNVRANRLARHLREYGVGQGEKVGVRVERSLEMVVGLLAVLKAGGCYVSPDLRQPRDRLRTIFADAGITVVLTQAHLLPELDGLAVPPGDPRSRRRRAGGPVPTSGCPAEPDRAAYVAFTSGSTGLPKGVVVPHRGVIRLVHEVDYARLGPASGCCACRPLAFDASTLEIWGALLTGATLEVHPAGRRRRASWARSWSSAASLSRG